MALWLCELTRIYVQVHEFFMSLDMPLMELYGMSESSGPHTMNFDQRGMWKVGTCGKKLLGVDLKLDNPDEEGDGEVGLVYLVSIIDVNTNTWYLLCAD